MKKSEKQGDITKEFIYTSWDADGNPIRSRRIFKNRVAPGYVVTNERYDVIELFDTSGRAIAWVKSELRRDIGQE